MLLLYASFLAIAMSAMSDADKLDLVIDHISGRSIVAKPSGAEETLDFIRDVICPVAPTEEQGGIDASDWEIGKFKTWTDNTIEMEGDLMKFTGQYLVAINAGLGEITAPFSVFAQIKSVKAGPGGGARLVFGRNKKCPPGAPPSCPPGAAYPAIDLHVGGWGRDRGTQAYQITGQGTICYKNDGNHRHVHGACRDPDWPLMSGDYFWMGISMNEQGEIKLFVGDNGEDLDTVKRTRLFNEELLPGVAGRPQPKDPHFYFSLSGYIWLWADESELLVKSFVHEPKYQTQSGKASRALGSSRMEFLPSRALSMGEEVYREVAAARGVDGVPAEQGLTHGIPFVWFGFGMLAGFVGCYGLTSRKKVAVTDESTTLLNAA